MTRRAGGVSTTGLTSLFPSLVTGARDGAYVEAIHDLSMRSVPLKSTLTPANSRGPAETSPELATFFTCSENVVTAMPTTTSELHLSLCVRELAAGCGLATLRLLMDNLMPHLQGRRKDISRAEGGPGRYQVQDDGHRALSNASRVLSHVGPRSVGNTFTMSCVTLTALEIQGSPPKSRSTACVR